MWNFERKVGKVRELLEKSVRKNGKKRENIMKERNYERKGRSYGKKRENEEKIVTKYQKSLFHHLHKQIFSTFEHRSSNKTKQRSILHLVPNNLIEITKSHFTN